MDGETATKPGKATKKAAAAVEPEQVPATYSGDIEPLTDHDLHLFNEGTHTRLYRKLGAQVGTIAGGDGVAGTRFAVWAPEAERVSVIGDWNDWDLAAQPLERVAASGLWQGFAPGVAPGALYKYHVVSRHRGYRADKADPFAFRAEVPPRQASVVWDLDYEWGDADWMAQRAERNGLNAPVATYEVHLGSWRRAPLDPDDPARKAITGGSATDSRPLTYREIAPLLSAYVKEMGFTHVELMPVMEHPYYGSWGYQITGYYAPTSRYGTPQDLMYLIDHLHQEGIGVILDWVPSHFATDAWALAFFDGTHLYEHPDPRKGYHPDWGSYIFNYGRPEVRSFLASNALYWLDLYHADGLRVDAVASMLYLDYSRKHGEWIPNLHGGRENLEAISLLRTVNEAIARDFPDVQTVAEESTAWPLVSRPTYLGGLGFDLKWDMGWMHDTLDYFAKDPIHRHFHHGKLTFRSVYAWSENYTLPLSHDEVVHGKGSLLNKMPGDDWQKFANLRLLFAYFHAQPGKKLLFMGGELGQWREWSHERSLDWHLLEEGNDPKHRAAQSWLADLNRLYQDEPALHELDCDPAGFEWIDCTDGPNSVLALLRKGKAKTANPIVVVLNFTPVVRENYRIGVPGGGRWKELLNSDAEAYGGSGKGNYGGVDAVPLPMHGRTHSVTLTLPPLGAVFLQREVAADAVTSPDK
jgi:1,4-alpha-glucan branching enzyme